jgi:hypothetical protein
VHSTGVQLFKKAADLLELEGLSFNFVTDDLLPCYVFIYCLMLSRDKPMVLSSYCTESERSTPSLRDQPIAGSKMKPPRLKM